MMLFLQVRDAERCDDQSIRLVSVGARRRVDRRRQRQQLAPHRRGELGESDRDGKNVVHLVIVCRRRQRTTAARVHRDAGRGPCSGGYPPVPVSK